MDKSLKTDQAVTGKTPRLLVVGPSWVGDMVMAQSLFMAVKAQNRDTEIHVLSPAWSEPVLQRMPEVSASIEMPVGHGSLQLGLRRKLGRQLKHNGYDQAIVLPGSFKSALVPWFAEIPRRTGYVGELRWGLINDIRSLDKSALPLNVQRYAALAQDKTSTPAKDYSNPVLQIDPEHRNQTLRKFNLSVSRPVVALCPGAEYGPAKRWPARHFAEAARAIQQAGRQVWIFGSSSDKMISSEINQMAGNVCTDLCGQTSLGEVIDLMSCAQHVVTNDSGLMHIASAAGSHVIALYGSSSDAFTPPLTDASDRLNLNLACSPCFKRECPLGHLNCLNNLVPQMVLDKILKH